MKAPEPSVVTSTGPPTFGPEAGADSCTETWVFAGQLAPETARSVPACTAGAASTVAAAVTSVVSVAETAPAVAVTVYPVPTVVAVGTK